MYVFEFEQRVWQVDRMRIVIRAPVQATVDDFNWTNRANQGMTVTEYIETRINVRIGDLEGIIIGGNGKQPRGNTLIGNVRLSYNE